MWTCFWVELDWPFDKKANLLFDSLHGWGHRFHYRWAQYANFLYSASIDWAFKIIKDKVSSVLLVTSDHFGAAEEA